VRRKAAKRDVAAARKLREWRDKDMRTRRRRLVSKGLACTTAPVGARVSCASDMRALRKPAGRDSSAGERLSRSSSERSCHHQSG
jgi:hypothetical protein